MFSFAVKENCHGGTEKRKKLFLCASVTWGDKPSS